MPVHKPKILVDFDGVVHKYSRGWWNGTTYDEPMEGAMEYLELLESLGYEVVIFSTRDAESIVAWLYLWNFPILRVTNIKEPAVALIDDRAIRFTSWEQAATDVLEYYPITLLAPVVDEDLVVEEIAVDITKENNNV